MRQASKISLLIVVGMLAMATWAADLVQSVPANAPAYAQLALLGKNGMLAGERTGLPTNSGSRILTRYDFGLALIEPLQRFVALIEAQESPTLAPLQRRRQELAYHAVSDLNEKEFTQLVSAATQLLGNFGDIVEALSPGLPKQAGDALRKLGQTKYRPWIAATPAVKPDARGSLHVSVDPKAEPSRLGSPLPERYLINLSNAPDDAGDGRGRSPLVGSKSVNTLQTAFDLTLGRKIFMYGSVATLPGETPSDLLTPEMRGKMMVGIQFNLARMSDLGISGFMEFHGLRTNDPANPGNTSTNTGTVTGIALSW